MGLLRPSKAELLLRIQTLETAVQKLTDEGSVQRSLLASLSVDVKGPETTYPYTLISTGVPKRGGILGEMDSLEAFIKACVKSVREDVRTHAESRVLHPELAEKDKLTAEADKITRKAEQIK